MINLLNNLDVKNVISIDNDYKDYDLDNIRDTIWENIEIFTKALQENDIKYHDEEMFWTSFDCKYSSLIRHEKTSRLFEENKKTLEYLDRLFADDSGILNFEKLPGTKKDVEQLLSTAENNKALIIIDKKLDGYNGIDIIKNLKKKNKLLSNFVILLTHEESGDSKDKIYSELGEEVPKTRISVVSKSDLIGKSTEEIAYRIKSEIHKQYLNIIISHLKDNTIEANYMVNKALLDLEKGFLDSIIFQFSDSEGVQPIENLFRIYNSEFNYSLKRTIGESINEYSKLLHNYEENFSDFRGLDFDFTKMYSFLNHERFDDTINVFRKSPGFGDIYLINDKLYMLGSQECDLMVRGQNENPKRKVSEGLLINLQEMDVNFDVINKQKNTSEVVRYFSRDHINYKALCANYYDVKLIDMLILDFCSFDDVGISKLKLNEHLNTCGLHTTVYYNYVSLKRQELIGKFNEDIEKISQFIKSRYDLNYSISEHEIKLDMKRLCRLDFNSAYLILQNYSVKMSRFPLPGDYAKTKRTIKIVKSSSNLFNKETVLSDGSIVTDIVYFDEKAKGQLTKKKTIELVANKYGADKRLFFYINSDTVMISNVFKYKDYFDSGSLFVRQTKDSQDLLDHLTKTANKSRLYVKARESFKITLEDLDINDRINIDENSYLQLYVENEQLQVSFVKIQAGD